MKKIQFKINFQNQKFVDRNLIVDQTKKITQTYLEQATEIKPKIQS